MQLLDYMIREKLDDAAFAALIGGIGPHGVKKWKYREREPDASQMTRIAQVTGGAVQLSDWAEPKRRKKTSSEPTPAPVATEGAAA